jgi:outer membrane protein assembly factor BamA
VRYIPGASAPRATYLQRREDRHDLMARSGTLGARRTPGKLSAAPAQICVAALCLLAWAPSLNAQRVWHKALYPYAYYSAGDGFWGAAHLGLYSPIGFAERPERDAASINFDAAASTHGSYGFVADAQLSGLWTGWRVRLTLSAARDNRLGFYGLGNDTPYEADSVTEDAPHFYQVTRTHQYARVTLQRKLIGPLRGLAGAGIRNTAFRALPGASAFTQDSAYSPFTDRTVRAGLVLDTRDNELAPHSGLMVEALFASGSGYTRTTGSARIFVHPLKRLVIAARVAGETTGGNSPLAAQLEMESSELPFFAVGGYYSLRGYRNGRFIGPGKLLGGLEVRYAPVWAPTVAELQIVGFYDAGRVFGRAESFRVTTTALHQSGGGEIAVRFLRNTFMVAGVGAGSEGARFVFGTQWSY